MVLWLVDAHPQFQAGMNVPRLAVEGYSALVVKATQGSTWRSDGTLEMWTQQAEQSGMLAGFYHWINDTNPVTQVNNFLNRVAGLGGVTGRLVQLDCEDNASYETVRRWLAEFRARTNNHPVLLYTGAWWWVPRGWNGAALTPYLWNSHYVSGSGYASSLYEKMPSSWWSPGYGGWNTSMITQFSSRGTAGGITANVDVNAFLGTIEQLRALAGMLSPQPQEEVDMNEAQAREAHNVEHVITQDRELFDRGDYSSKIDVDYGEGPHGVSSLGRVILDTVKKALTETPQPVTISDAQLHQLAVDVVGLLAPQFKDVADIKRALGDSGDAQTVAAQMLGKLNDQ